MSNAISLGTMQNRKIWQHGMRQLKKMENIKKTSNLNKLA